MSVILKVVTTTEFPDMEAVHDFMKGNGAFDDFQVAELLEDGELTITEERDQEEIGTVSPTTSVFTLEDK